MSFCIRLWNGATGWLPYSKMNEKRKAVDFNSPQKDMTGWRDAKLN